MYQPAAFAETHPQRLHDLVRAHPLGLLVTSGAEAGPVVDALPFALDTPAQGPARLLAHVARANPLWHTHPVGQPVLVVFQGPQAYVSPGWYPSKAEHGKAVPTWNYTLVQARGTLRVIDGDPVWMRVFLAALTHTHESTQPQPWRMDDAPPAYIDAMLQAVVGLEIEVIDLQGKFKLSQNQPQPNQAGVYHALVHSHHPGDQAVAAWMPVAQNAPTP